jgi:hypothetical protein
LLQTQKLVTLVPRTKHIPFSQLTNNRYYEVPKKMRVDLLGSRRSWFLSPRVDGVGCFKTCDFYCKDVIEHVLNLLFKELDIVIIIGICSIKDLLPVDLVGSLKIEFNFSNQCRTFVPSYELFSMHDKLADELKKDHGFRFRIDDRDLHFGISIGSGEILTLEVCLTDLPGWFLFT